jgi:hypothetical protein
LNFQSSFTILKISGGGTLYEMSMQTGAILLVVNDAAGHPIWNASWAVVGGVLGDGVVVSTAYPSEIGYDISDWEFYVPATGEWIYIGNGDQAAVPAFCGFSQSPGAFYFATGMYVGAEYNFSSIVTITNPGLDLGLYYSYEMVDAFVYDGGAQFDIWAFAGLAFNNAEELFALVAPAKVIILTGGPEQVLTTQILVGSVNVQYAPGKAPGVSVNNAAFVAFGAGYVWASDPTDGIVTAITVNN